MRLALNTPELYQKRVNFLNKQLKSVTSPILQNEINKSILYTDVAIAAFADLQKALQYFHESYNSKNGLIQEKLSSLYNEMRESVKFAQESQKEYAELSFNFLKIEVESIHSLQDADISILEVIRELGGVWLNLLNSIFEGEINDQVRKKIAFLAKIIGGQIPYLNNFIEIITTIDEAIKINSKDAKSTDDFLNKHQKYHTALSIYIFGCINFRLDSLSVINEQPILTDDEKNTIIQNHYKDVIECRHFLYVSNT